MASWMVHLRIADELLPQLRDMDETAFVMGNMAPDSGVPNADWSQFQPPKSVTHFYKNTASGRLIDTEAFCARYFNPELIRGYDGKAYSFFLGYYVHLLTDVRWAETIGASLKKEHPQEYAADKRKLFQAAKEDWYDLDFLYLERRPDFKAFSIYENSAGFDNVYMDIFGRDALENRRQSITAFYRGKEHGVLHRKYPYLTPEQADTFVRETSKWILSHANGLREG